jgi:hypothetical protein
MSFEVYITGGTADDLSVMMREQAERELAGHLQELCEQYAPFISRAEFNGEFVTSDLLAEGDYKAASIGRHARPESVFPGLKEEPGENSRVPPELRLRDRLLRARG